MIVTKYDNTVSAPNSKLLPPNVNDCGRDVRIGSEETESANIGDFRIVVAICIQFPLEGDESVAAAINEFVSYSGALFDFATLRADGQKAHRSSASEEYPELRLAVAEITVVDGEVFAADTVSKRFTNRL